MKINPILALLLVVAYRTLRVQARVFATTVNTKIIQTQYGKIRGVLITLPNEHLPVVEAYLGLQYASVLEGELRFMPPTSPVYKWEGVRVAHKFSAVCPQKIPDIEELKKHLPIGRVDHYKRLLPFLEQQKEECLNLNVYVPVRGECMTCRLAR